MYYAMCLTCWARILTTKTMPYKYTRAYFFFNKNQDLRMPATLRKISKALKYK